MTGFDHGAVDGPGDHRGDLARGDRNHDLVEQRHSAGCISERDQRLSITKTPKCLQVPIAEAVGDLHHVAEGGVRILEIAAHQTLQRRRHKQIPKLDAVALSIVEQPARTRKPSPGPCKLARIDQSHGHVDRGPHGPRLVSQAQECVVSTLPDVHARLLLVRQEGGGGEPVQVVRRERAGAVGGR